MKHSSDSPSLTQCSTSLLVIVNEALYDPGPAYVDSLISLCCYTGSTNSEQPKLPQINPAVLLLRVFACTLPPALHPHLVHQETVLPSYLGQQAPVWEAFSSSSLSECSFLPLHWFCPISYIYLCFTCLPI